MYIFKFKTLFILLKKGGVEEGAEIQEEVNQKVFPTPSTVITSI